MYFWFFFFFHHCWSFAWNLIDLLFFLNRLEISTDWTSSEWAINKNFISPDVVRCTRSIKRFLPSSVIELWSTFSADHWQKFELLLTSCFCLFKFRMPMACTWLLFCIRWKTLSRTNAQLTNKIQKHGVTQLQYQKVLVVKDTWVLQGTPHYGQCLYIFWRY